jgi:uncharacterized membrane protein
MNNGITRFLLIAIGVILLVVGLVFTGQGSGLIQGSTMTGSRMWLLIGIVLAIVGIVLVVLGIRRRRR